MYDSGLCFVCTHLSSGEGGGDDLKRNYDYSEIVRRGAFPSDAIAPVEPSAVVARDPLPTPGAYESGITKVRSARGAAIGLLRVWFCVGFGSLDNWKGLNPLE